MEYVAMRRRRRTSCRAANVAFVAIRRVGVGPGVKMDIARSVRKVAMVATTLLGNVVWCEYGRWLMADVYLLWMREMCFGVLVW